MTLRNFLTLLLPATAAIVAFSSCDRHPDVIGTWTATPTRIDNISAACDASATFSISFTESENNAECGDVLISAVIDANQPVEAEESTLDQPYEVSVAATAIISGKWSYEKDDDEDIVVTLDPTTLTVNVDPNGITFSNDVLTGTQHPMLDSLSNSTASAWKKSITKALGERLFQINKISDIKVSNDIMSCEIRDRDYTLRRSE